MAIPKKGARKITVDGVEYRWRIRWKPTYSQCIDQGGLAAAVELYEKPQSALLIYFPWARYDSWLGVPEHPITPKLIEESVKAALVKGWQPDKRGGFEISYRKVKTIENPLSNSSEDNFPVSK